MWKIIISRERVIWQGLRMQLCWWTCRERCPKRDGISNSFPLSFSLFFSLSYSLYTIIIVGLFHVDSALQIYWISQHLESSWNLYIRYIYRHIFFISNFSSLGGGKGFFSMGHLRAFALALICKIAMKGKTVGGHTVSPSRQWSIFFVSNLLCQFQTRLIKYVKQLLYV